MASMVGFVAGLPFLYQMVSRDRQLEVPKYVRPRTDTPALTVGHGGCFGCIYSVRGAGGYQMFGITPGPDLRPASGELPDFKDFVCFFEPGDIVKFEPIDRERYDELRDAGRAGRDLDPRKDVTFDLEGSTPIRTRTTGSCWRCSVPIEVIKPGLATTVQDRGRRGLLPRRRAAVRRPRPVLARSREPAGRQRTGSRDARVRATMGRELRFTEDARRRRDRGRDRAEASTARRSRAGRRSRCRRATCSRSATSSAARGSTSRSPAASTCPRCCGSRSTYALGALGGFDGRALAAGDELAIGSSRRQAGRAVGARGPAPRPAERARDPSDDGPLRPSADRRRPRDVHGHAVDADAGRRPRRLPLQGRRARHGPARAAVRRRQRSRRTSSTRPTRSGRSRCPAASSRSSCTATRSRAAGTR